MRRSDASSLLLPSCLPPASWDIRPAQFNRAHCTKQTQTQQQPSLQQPSHGSARSVSRLVALTQCCPLMLAVHFHLRRNCASSTPRRHGQHAAHQAAELRRRVCRTSCPHHTRNARQEGTRRRCHTQHGSERHASTGSTAAQGQGKGRGEQGGGGKGGEGAGAGRIHSQLGVRRRAEWEIHRACGRAEDSSSSSQCAGCGGGQVRYGGGKSWNGADGEYKSRRGGAESRC